VCNKSDYQSKSRLESLISRDNINIGRRHLVDRLSHFFNIFGTISYYSCSIGDELEIREYFVYLCIESLNNPGEHGAFQDDDSQWSRNSLTFMKPKRSLPCLQQLVTKLYFDLLQPCPQFHSYSSELHFNITLPSFPRYTK
jgi:hypothetical protein